MRIRNRMIAAFLIMCMGMSVGTGSTVVYAQETQEVQVQETQEAQVQETQEAQAQETQEAQVQETQEAQAQETQEAQAQETQRVDDAENKSDIIAAEEDADNPQVMGAGEASGSVISAEDEDPGNGRLAGNIPEEFYGSESGFATMATSITHDARFADYYKVKGIDVSKWNGNINWAKVKAAGIEYAFVRIGARGAESGKMIEDEYAIKNMQNAAAAGVKVGAYIFSQAITEKEAIEEADYMTQRLKGYKITMPVVFDFEYYSGGRLSKKKLDANAQTKICLAACNRIKQAGYTPMLYANLSMLEKHLNAKDISDKYMIWLARYNSYAGYAGEYDYWQYTSDGSVSGISGRVDMNFWYTKTNIGTQSNKEAEADPKVFTDLKMTGKTNGTDIVVRKSNSTEDKKLAILDINKSVSITAQNNEWYRITLKIDGAKKTGYISKKYVTIISKPSVSAKVTSKTKVKLSWKKVSGAGGYEVQRYNSSQKKWTKIKTIKKGSTVTYTNSGLKKKTSYKYRVRAYREVRGNKIYSDYSASKTVKTK